MTAKPLDQYNIAEVTLIYRRKTNDKHKIVVSEAIIAYEIFKEEWDENKIDLQEEFKILLLRRNNTCLGVSHVARGGVSSCAVDPKIIFATALKTNACQIILAHNHPSGNLQPSSSDLALTKQLIDGGKLLDIKVLDHIIMSSDGYLSMSNAGLMPF